MFEKAMDDFFQEIKDELVNDPELKWEIKMTLTWTVWICTYYSLGIHHISLN